MSDSGCRMKKSIVIFTILLSTSVLSAQLRIWSSEGLAKARKERPADVIKSIQRIADKELTNSIRTVMDKDMTPPSGDKHDYMSMGRYWWPDPTKKDGLPYIRKDGVVNKEIDKLDRSPLSLMARSVKYLSLAYYLSDQSKYAYKAAENLKIWFINPATSMNPNMNFGQIIPGRNDGSGRGEGIIDTYSLLEMLDGIELIKDSEALPASDMKKLKGWFSDYLDWLLQSETAKDEYNSENNHGTAFDVQVVRYALFVGRDDVARRFVNDFPARRIYAQIEPDGRQPKELARTTAFGYSIFNLSHMLDMCVMAQTMGIDLYNKQSADGRSLAKAVDFLGQFLGKSQTDFPYKQIKEWDKQQENLCWLIHTVTLFSKDPKYKQWLLNASEWYPRDIRYYTY